MFSGSVQLKHVNQHVQKSSTHEKKKDFFKTGGGQRDIREYTSLDITTYIKWFILAIPSYIFTLCAIAINIYINYASASTSSDKSQITLPSSSDDRGNHRVI